MSPTRTCRSAAALRASTRPPDPVPSTMPGRQGAAPGPSASVSSSTEFLVVMPGGRTDKQTGLDAAHPWQRANRGDGRTVGGLQRAQ